MEYPISSFREELNILIKSLKNNRVEVVNQNNIREQTRKTVKQYFEKHRPLIIYKHIDEQLIEGLDSSMQELLRYCNKRTLRKKYLDLLKKCTAQINELEEASLVSDSNHSSKLDLDINNQEKSIIKTLFDISPNAATSYNQALKDIKDSERISWRGTIAELRECLRETLDELAPDKTVKSQPSFKLEKDRKKPTMKQKVVFILRKRKVASAAVDNAKHHIDLIEEMTGSFIRSVYDYSSAKTHGNAKLDDAISVRRHVTLILSELLEI